MEKKYLIFNPLSGQYEETFDENQIGPIKQRLAMELYNSMINGHPAKVIEETQPIPQGSAPLYVGHVSNETNE
jgi:hypothetical protein